MSLNVRALAVSVAIVWGVGFMLVGLLNLIFPSYGVAWLELGAALYPGYAGPAGLGSVIVVTMYGLVDGAVAGAVLAWLYNLVARSGRVAVS